MFSYSIMRFFDSLASTVTAESARRGASDQMTGPIKIPIPSMSSTRRRSEVSIMSVTNLLIWNLKSRPNAFISQDE